MRLAAISNIVAIPIAKSSLKTSRRSFGYSGGIKEDAGNCAKPAGTGKNAVE
jgi:hypothetical protein